MSAWRFFLEHRAEILGATANHLTLVLIAMAFAIAIAVPLGMFIVHRPTLRNVALALASIFQTIPSLALFGFLIPIPFIGGIRSSHRKSSRSFSTHCSPSSATRTSVSPASIPPSSKPPKPWA